MPKARDPWSFELLTPDAYGIRFISLQRASPMHRAWDPWSSDLLTLDAYEIRLISLQHAKKVVVGVEYLL